MRVPIYAHDSNPAVDARILKYSLTRCESDVAAGWLRWVDTKDKSKGCIARFRVVRNRDRQGFWDGLPVDITAWRVLQSGYAGPLVMQLSTPAGVVSEANA